MRKNSPLLAIYDENTLQRQLLHHEIENLGFSVAFSCEKKEKLYENLKTGNSPVLLMMSANNRGEEILRIMKHAKFLCREMKVMIYVCNENNSLASEFKKEGALEVILSCSVGRLVSTLDLLFPDSAKPAVKIPLEDIEGYTFVIRNKKNIQVLKGMSEDMSNENIGKLADLTPSSVETYKKRIREALNCNSGKEAVAKAKGYLII